MAQRGLEPGEEMLQVGARARDAGEQDMLKLLHRMRPTTAPPLRL